MPDALRAPWFKITLILICAAAVYLIGNASVPLWDRDEPRYAQTSRQMLRSGDWVVPRLLDEVRTAKPIFIYWCQVMAMAMLGENEFAARLPSAIAMLLTLLLLGTVIHRTVGPRRAVWAIFILGSSGLAIATAKLCITDSVLLLWVTSAHLCLLGIYIAGERRAWVLPLVMWLAISLAGLTKGPVVLGILIMTMIALALLDVGQHFRRGESWRRALGWWRRTRPLVGIGIIVLVCGPWIWLVERRAPGFIMTSIGHDVIHRSRTALEGHSGPPGYYLVSIWVTYFPWSLLLPAAIAYAWKRRDSAIHRYSLAAIVGPWVMFELVQTKLVHYVLPVFPALAFLTADMLVHAARSRGSFLKRTLFVRVAMAWAIVVALAGAVPWLAGRYFALDRMLIIGATGISVVCIVYASAVAQQFRLRRPLRAAGIMGGGMWVFVAVLYSTYLPHAGFLKLSPRIAQTLAAEGAIDPDDVVMIDYQEDTLGFYTAGTVRRTADQAYLLTTPRWEWPRWIIVSDLVWQAMPPNLRAEFDEVARVRGWWYAKGRGAAELLVVRKKTLFTDAASEADRSSDRPHRAYASSSSSSTSSSSY